MKSCVVSTLHLRLDMAETGALYHVLEQHLQNQRGKAKERWIRTMGGIRPVLLKAADEYQESAIEIHEEQAEVLRHLFVQDANRPQEQANLLDDIRREVESCWP